MATTPTTPKPLAVPPSSATPVAPKKATTVAPTPIAPRTPAGTTPANTAVQRQAPTPSFWHRSVMGIPVWMVGLVVAVAGGYWLYRKFGR